MNQINAIRRFITLIDCFYDYQVILRCFAQAAPHELFHQDAQYSGKFAVQDEVFSFDRTISRLIEVRVLFICFVYRSGTILQVYIRIIDAKPRVFTSMP